MTVYVVTYIGLSNSESSANGYCDLFVFSIYDKAKKCLKELKEAEKDNLQSCSERCDLFKPLTCWCLDDYPPCMSIFNKKFGTIHKQAAIACIKRLVDKMLS